MSIAPVRNAGSGHAKGIAGFKPPFASLGRGRSGAVLRLLRNHTALILLIVLIIAGGLLSDVFLTSRNLLNIMWAVSILGIIALGQTVLLITCNFDMSVAFVVGLAGIVTVLAQIAGFDLVTSMALGLAAGLAIGAVNGLLVVYTGANPFLITLGTALLAYSVSLMLTRSQTLYATIPEFNELGRGRLFGVVHYSVILVVVLALTLEFVLRRTAFGRSLYVIGLNETAGRMSGLAIRRVKLVAFALCGGTAALAGLIMTSRTGSTVASAGAGMEFDSIIAAVLGGTSLFGGHGGALRTLVGVLVLGVLNNLLILLSVPIEGQQIAKGLVFLAVVWADSVLRHP
ncbi:MAG: ABC transporter permease [Rhizobiales bacterium]|nr:ABC transporter permease [Hyphomicrobiales bacterium]